ncbi:MAG: universal stress protein [Chthoniobacter sp.]|nr:universal stress protein [Chthoniobacter sp.]
MKTILVPVDFSDTTTPVLAEAELLAKALGCDLVLLKVAEPEPDFVGFEPGPQTVRATVAQDFRAEHARLDDLKAVVEANGVTATAMHVQGPIVEKILAQAAERSATMIVMGSHGHGAFYELLVGSITQGVLKDAKCPVVVVPAAGRT